MLDNVKNVTLILSGKGGVGKSTVAVQLSLALASQGKRVGLLDIDLCGPSVPLMLGLSGEKVTQGEKGWIPVVVKHEPNLIVMSIGFLLSSPDSAVIWRGPKKNAMIRQFISDVDWCHYWDTLDYLIVDTPPGTSDEHISVVETLQGVRQADGVILVSTPQGLSIADVRREIAFCKRANLKITGLIENMSGYVCPHCAHCCNVFSSGGAKSLAQMTDVPFLASIPIDPRLTECEDSGEDFVTKHQDSQAAINLKSVALALIDSCNISHGD
jgi:Mrp family chromosome partitioning ATPase